MALTPARGRAADIRSDEPPRFGGIGAAGWLSLLTIAAVAYWLVKTF